MVFDTPEQLLDKIRLGEDSLLECKEMAFAGGKVKGPRRSVFLEFVGFNPLAQRGYCRETPHHVIRSGERMPGRMLERNLEGSYEA